MNRILLSALCTVVAATCQAQAVGSLAEVTLIDRDSGSVLSPHYYRGEYWVAGRPGARYAILIRNCLGERVMAVTSVDGVNVVSGATAGWDQTGYVFGPSASYQITGWRKSDAQVAAFTFTASPNSYAARTGRPANVGVIGVAVFREQAPQPEYTPPVIGRLSAQQDAARELASDSKSNQSLAKSEAAAGGNPASMSDQRRAPESPPLRADAPAPKLGTGHGDREYSYVNHTDFQRMQSTPNEVIRIHYDSMDNLLAMGIVKRPRPIPAATNPFPASPDPQYVADPAG